MNISLAHSAKQVVTEQEEQVGHLKTILKYDKSLQSNHWTVINILGDYFHQASSYAWLYVVETKQLHGFLFSSTQKYRFVPFWDQK